METKFRTDHLASYWSAGRSSILSGAFGIAAFACLFLALWARSSGSTQGAEYLFRGHDVGVIVQLILLVPGAVCLAKLSRHSRPAAGNKVTYIGAAALLLAALALLLIFPKLVADIYYMIPQGVFGSWLIYVCWRTRGVLSSGLRRFGTVVGFGLVVVGLFPVLLEIFVYPGILHLPPVDVGPDIDSPINRYLHQALGVGSLLGVFTLPIWSILLGRQLAHAKAE